MVFGHAQHVFLAGLEGVITTLQFVAIMGHVFNSMVKLVEEHGMEAEI
jgi:hypothetical protein